MVAKRVYTPEERGDALSLLGNPSLTLADVHEQTRIPKSTLRHWCEVAGIVRTEDTKKTERATAARIARIKEKREIIREAILDEAAETLARFREASITYVGKAGIEVKLERPIPRDAQALATAFGILIDKFRLESGEHTESTRTEVSSPREAIKARLDELSERRANREAV